MANTETMTIYPLASGSSGNAYFVRSGQSSLLLDAGISRKRLREGLHTVGAELADLDGILITHEHIDHVRALPMIRKHDGPVPIFATRGTARACSRTLHWKPDTATLAAGQSLFIGSFMVSPFATSHDAAESVGFRIEVGSCRLALATDLGAPDATVVEALRGCHVLLLEANYEESLLRDGPYPEFLKERIRSKRGHLSNLQTRELLEEVAGDDLQHVVLAHLSAENNRAELAIETVRGALAPWPKAQLSVAPRTAPGDPIVVAL